MTQFTATCAKACFKPSFDTTTKSLRNDLAARAIDCLARSHAAGFFSDASRGLALQNTPALAVLRSRHDIQKLLDEVVVAPTEN